MAIPALDVPRIQVSDCNVFYSISRSLTPLCPSFLLFVLEFHSNSSFQITLPFAFFPPHHLSFLYLSSVFFFLLSVSLTASWSHRSRIIMFYWADFFIKIFFFPWWRITHRTWTHGVTKNRCDCWSYALLVIYRDFIQLFHSLKLTTCMHWNGSEWTKQ